MLKIDKILLVSGAVVVREIDFSKKINFIKMGNSKGKTSLFYLIDYLLGSSSITLSQETFKGIDCAQLCTNHGIFMRRINDTNFFSFKLRLEDPDNRVSSSYYLAQIESSSYKDGFNDNETIKASAGDNISFRTYTLFNFLDEHFLGRIDKVIFSKQMLPEYYRGKYIFDYIFNKDNIIEINNLKREVEELNKTLIKTRIENEIIDKKNERLRSLLIELGIKYYPNDNNKTLIEINNYENNLMSSTEKLKEEDDFYYLWETYNNLVNVIRKLRYQKATFVNHREINNKRLLLLSSLKNLYDDNNKEIVEPIVNLVSKCEIISTGIDSNNLDESIKELEKRRNELLSSLQIAKASNKEYDIDEKKTSIVEAKLLLKEVMEYKKVEDVELSRKIKEKIKKIKELKNSYDSSMEDKVSSLLNDYYSSLKGKDYEFVDADYKKNNFKLFFNYRKMLILSNVTTKNDDGNTYDSAFMLESMSRQTVIQLCAYFAFNEIIRKEFNFPVINTLFLDNVSKPLETKNKPIIMDLFNVFIKRVEDFNIIATTDCDDDNNGINIYYKDGLNPNYY